MSDFNGTDSTGKFVPDLLHLGSTERRSQDAPHSLPAFIPQHEQTVAHGLGDEAQTLCKEQADATQPLELNHRENHIETQAHHSVWETAEVLDHHLSQHVGVSHHHHWFTAQIVPETHEKEN